MIGIAAVLTIGDIVSLGNVGVKQGGSSRVQTAEKMIWVSGLIWGCWMDWLSCVLVDIKKFMKDHAHKYFSYNYPLYSSFDASKDDTDLSSVPMWGPSQW